MSFQPYTPVILKPGTYHNQGYRARDLLVTFVRYMAGEKYAIVRVDYSNSNLTAMDIRVNVDDLLPVEGTP